MADSKISELTALTSPASDDVLPIVDTSAGVTKKITVSNLQSTSFQFVLEDGDGTEVTINNNNEVKFVEGGGIDINWTDTDNGSDADPYDLTFSIDSTVATLTGSQTLTNKTLTSPVLNTGVSGTAIKDEDNMASDSATHLATQQSIKAYVDTTVAATNEVVEDTSPQLGGDLDVNGNAITSASNGHIEITPNGTGKVGISESSPDTLLHITQSGEPPAEGMLILEANSGSRQLRIQPPTNSDNGFIDYRGGNLVFMDDGTEVARFQGTTGFGIGTSSPSEKITIQSGNLNFMGGTNDAQYIKFGDTGDDDIGNIFYYHGNNNMVFTTNASEAMRIDSSGRLGIGESSALGKLHVKSADSGASVDASADELVIEGSANTGISILSGASNSGSIYFGDSGLNYDGYIAYSQSSRNFSFGTAGAERMRIDSSGNVGIGTSSPLNQLHVRGSGNGIVRFDGNANSNTSTLLVSHNTAGDCGLQFNSNQLNMFSYGDIAFFPSTSNISGSYPNGQTVVFKNSGNVGIGTASPSAALEIFSGTQPQLKVGSASATADRNAGLLVYAHNSATAGSRKIEMFLDADGGTSSGSDNLHIEKVGNAGDATIHQQCNASLILKTKGTMILSTNDTERMRITSDGKVGIGTSSPISELQVDGASTPKITVRSADGTSASVKLQRINENDVQTDFELKNDGGAFKIKSDSASQNEYDLFKATPDETIIYTGNTERMRINSSGNVSIGTTDAHAQLTVMSASCGAGANGDADELQLEGSGNAGMTIASGSSSSGNIHFADVGAANRGILTYDHSADQMKFGTAGTIRARFTSVGDLLVAKSSSDYGAVGHELLAGGLAAHSRSQNPTLLLNRNTSEGTIQLFRYNNSDVGSISVTSSSTAFNTSSDYRLKENVSYDFDATSRLKQLKPSRFNFIADADKTVDGFLAHEVSDIVPEAITGEKDETETKEKVVLNANGNVIAEGIEEADWVTGKSDILWTSDDTETQDILYTSDDVKTQDVLYTEEDELPEGVEVGDVKESATKSVGDVKQEATQTVGDVKTEAIYPSDSTWEASKVIPVYQGIDQSKLVPLLVKTIQELEARITTLENN